MQKFVVRDIPLLSFAVNNLRASKPAAEDKIDIKLYLLDFDKKIAPVAQREQELVNVYQEAIKEANDDEALKLKHTEIFNQHKNELYAETIELHDFKSGWVKYCDLTVQQEIELEKILQQDEEIAEQAQEAV